MIGRRVVAVAVAGFVLAACSSATKNANPSSTASSRGPTSTTTATTTPSTTKSTPSPSVAPYLGLWPFRTVGEVQSWQHAYRSGGDESWHLDATTTALDFTMDYLGYREINVAAGTTVNSTGAHVAVGFRPTRAVTSKAAVVHLVRWGSGSDAPWEVVGTDDTTFSLTDPVYGATAASPLRVGGTITGVDENIKVTVRQPSSSTAIGSFCCIPAGGSASAWSATVTFGGATDPVLTVTATTGGHVQTVERFTVTGVRPAVH